MLTGNLGEDMPRHRAEEELRALGARVSGSVSKRTSFVVAGENAGSKLDKAITLGVPVLGREDLDRIIESGEVPEHPSA